MPSTIRTSYEEGRQDTLADIYRLMTNAEGRTEAYEQTIEFIEENMRML